MGTACIPKYIRYSYMDPLGLRSVVDRQAPRGLGLNDAPNLSQPFEIVLVAGFRDCMALLWVATEIGLFAGFAGVDPDLE